MVSFWRADSPLVLSQATHSSQSWTSDCPVRSRNLFNVGSDWLADKLKLQFVRDGDGHLPSKPGTKGTE